MEPLAWLTDLFRRLPYHRRGEAYAQASRGEAVTSTDLDDLLPDAWLRAHPDHVWSIDTIRREERTGKPPRRQPPQPV